MITTKRPCAEPKINVYSFYRYFKGISVWITFMFQMSNLGSRQRNFPEKNSIWWPIERKSVEAWVIQSQSIEARCEVDNEDAVGAAPTGDAPTTSEWSIILFSNMVRLILEFRRWVQGMKHELYNWHRKFSQLLVWDTLVIICNAHVCK